MAEDSKVVAGLQDSDILDGILHKLDGYELDFLQRIVTKGKAHDIENRRLALDNAQLQVLLAATVQHLGPTVSMPLNVINDIPKTSKVIAQATVDAHGREIVKLHYSDQSIIMVAKGRN